MFSYFIRRVIQSVFVVIGVTIIVFAIIHLLPGGPARAELGPRASAHQIHHFRVVHNLNKPIYVQYFDYIYKVLHGNFGYSYHYNESVRSLLAINLPKSALLLALSYIVALIMAIPIGIFQAVKRNSLWDHLFTGGALITYSMPVFWLGIILILIFSVHLNLLPAEAPQGQTIAQIISHPKGLILPVLTIALVNVALFSRFVRGSAIENLVQDYITTARGKGLSERSVLFGHLVKNSLMPTITLFGLSFPTVITWFVVAESVFNYPGLGLLFWHAAMKHGYATLMGVTIVISIGTVLGNLIADLLYAVVDPRIKLS